MFQIRDTPRFKRLPFAWETANLEKPPGFSSSAFFCKAVKEPVGCGRPLALSLGPAQGLAFAAGSALAFYLGSLVFTPIYRRCRSQDTPAAFRGLPAALLAVGLLSLAFFGFAP